MTHVILGVSANCETSDFERSDADFEQHGIWTVSLWDSISRWPDLKKQVTQLSATSSRSQLSRPIYLSGIPGIVEPVLRVLRGDVVITLAVTNAVTC